jgi:hypothetical protein
LTSQATWVRNSLVSNAATSAAPDLPMSKLCQNSSAVKPMEVTAPKPVITTRQDMVTFLLPAPASGQASVNDDAVHPQEVFV